MPAISFDAKNRGKSVFDTEQLRLKANEKARIAVLEDQARYRWVHRAVERVNDEDKFRNYFCNGREETLQEQKSDPERCQLCAVAEPGRDAAIGLPYRRFVLNIARYATNPRGQIIAPSGAAPTVVHQRWVFTIGKFNLLIDRAAEHGRLTDHDLVITCTNQGFQTFDIDVSAKCAWREDKRCLPAIKEILAAIKNEGDDVERLLGQAYTAEQVSRLLNQRTGSVDATVDAAIDTVIEEASAFTATQIGAREDDLTMPLAEDDAVIRFDSVDVPQTANGSRRR